MLVFFNDKGFVFTLIWGFLAGFCWLAWQINPLFIFVPTIFVSDIISRFRFGNGSLFSPKNGGHIYFIPMWIWAILFTIFGIVAKLGLLD